ETRNPKMQTPANKCSHTLFWITIGGLVLVLFLSLALNIGLAIGLITDGKGGSLGAAAVDEFPSLTETWSYGEGDVKVARIPLQGFIGREGGDGIFTPHFDKIEMLLSQIRVAQHDDDIRAIILEVDSPGGVITPSDEIYRALKAFRESAPDRKVVAFTRDLAASGAYYAAVAGDWIVAEPTAIVGSIGVIMQTLNWKALSDKIGVHDVTIKSRENKDILNPFREVQPQQLDMLQSMIDKMYQRFLGIVAEERGIEKEKLDPIADGSIFAAEEALSHGLIDQIGYWDDALAATAKLLGVDSIQVVRYEQQLSFFDMLTQLKARFSLPRLQDASSPRLMYLWRP
ncbi:MAG: signal peptide peptidase SppA, partial [Verrucomicrobia bacterium]|nr:signal peptide peptidase SppA [Verrucomicrobiota bacterium]